LMRCLDHRNPDVVRCAEESIRSIVISHGCMKKTLSPGAWRFFLQTTLMRLIPRTNEDPVHSRAVLKDLYVHLISEFQQEISDYRDDVLKFLIYCCAREDLPLRNYALESVRQYVEVDQKAFEDQEPMMNLLVKLLISLVPLMSSSVLFVEVIAKFIEVFAAKPDAVQQFMNLLILISDECHKVNEQQVHECWCSARLVAFRNLIQQARADDTAAFLRETVDLFFGYADVDVWRNMVVDCLKFVKGLECAAFESCMQTSLRLTCDLIETESEEIREQVIDILKRRLGKQATASA